MEQLKDFFKNEEITSIIDVGAGTGDFIAVLKSVFPKAGITGIDPNVASLNEAKEKFPDVSFMEMGAEKLEFNDNSFDLASISMALHHVPDVQKALKEMKRVVKPNGWIIVNELYSDNLNPAQEVHKMFHHFRSKIDRLTGVSHNKTFKRNDIPNMVKNSGIEVLLDFDNIVVPRLIIETNEFEEKMNKMKQNLERIKGLPEYDLLKHKISEFREGVKKFGFQSPPRIVLVGKPGE